jgi:type II secretory pathway pseudopilin PulG
MVAFIIMAVLSAVAIPSLIGVVGNDQVTADNTSAVAIADAAYYNGQSEAGQATPAVPFPITAAEATTFVPSGTVVTVTDGTDLSVNGGNPYLIFTFADGGTVFVTAPQTAGGATIDAAGTAGYIPNGSTIVSVADGTTTIGGVPTPILVFNFGGTDNVCVIAPQGAGASSPTLVDAADCALATIGTPIAGPGGTTTTVAPVEYSSVIIYNTSGFGFDPSFMCDLSTNVCTGGPNGEEVAGQGNGTSIAGTFGSTITGTGVSIEYDFSNWYPEESFNTGTHASCTLTGATGWIYGFAGTLSCTDVTPTGDGLWPNVVTALVVAFPSAGYSS